MSKLLGCLFIATGTAIGGLAMTLTGDRSQAALDTAAAINGPEGRSIPEVATRAVMQPERKPVSAFHTVTVPNDPVSIARALQTELRRVGCYGGEINGIWTPASQRAAKFFTDRVNATLPIDKPDYVLLALAQAQGGPVCGAACPSGQVQSERGVCSPASVVAAAQRRQQLGQRTAALAPPAQPPPPATTSQIKQASGAATLPERHPEWIVKVSPAPHASEPEEAPKPPLASDAPRMALAGPSVKEATAPPSGEKAEPERRRPRVHVERRRVYAEVRRRPHNWVNEFFRKIDRDSF